jgi:sarcosine oxidase
MDGRYDAIVVGVGSMGSAACWRLALRGARVLGLEQFEIGHALGSGHGRGRIFRTAYFEHPDYVPLLRRSLELWREAETASGSRLLEMTGGLWMGPPDDPLVAGSIDAARRHGLEHEVLSRDVIRRRYPAFHPPPGFTGFHEPLAGVLAPEQSISAFAALARDLGAKILERVRVITWRATPAGVEVETDGAVYAADRIIFTSGPWSADVLRELGIDLVVTRQIAAWFEPVHAELLRSPRMPCWAASRCEGGFHYGFPLDDGAGFKMAVHHPAAPVTPQTASRTVAPEEVEPHAAFLRSIIPDAAGPLRSASVCLYTNSPDGHFIVDLVRETRGRAAVACGFSGHGFKFAPVIGEALADLALGGRSDLPIGFLGLDRFAAARNTDIVTQRAHSR